MRRALAVLLALAVSAASDHAVWADPLPASRDRPAAPPEVTEPTPPWSVGVSAERKARANVLLARGNELLVENRFADALAQYRLAIAAWDHPAIRANMVVCLINLGRPLEAYESAVLALRYGTAPHQKPEVYAATLAYRTALEGQIGGLELDCSEPGARVTLDGQELVVCPRRIFRPVLVGRHQVVARQRGYLTVTRDLVIGPRTIEVVSLRMISIADATVTERPWPAWKPWAMTGAGLGLVAAGGALQLLARSNIRRHDEALERACMDRGCAAGAVDPWIQDLEARARRQERLAMGSFVAGGALAVSGLVWVYVNRPRTILPEGISFGMAPVGSDGGGLVLGGSF